MGSTMLALLALVFAVDAGSAAAPTAWDYRLPIVAVFASSRKG